MKMIILIGLPDENTELLFLRQSKTLELFYVYTRSRKKRGYYFYAAAIFKKCSCSRLESYPSPFNRIVEPETIEIYCLIVKMHSPINYYKFPISASLSLQPTVFCPPQNSQRKN